MKYFLFLLVASTLCWSCNYNRSLAELTMKPLSEAGFIIDSLPQGTPVNIVAWSGGMEEDKNGVYLEQFIVVDKNNGDTVRVLTRFISVPGEDENNDIYSPASTYDPDMDIRDAIYKQQREDERVFDAVTISQNADGEMDTGAVMKAITDSAELRKFVVMNSRYPIFSRTYKTVLGRLHFEMKPWK
jgi:hypothetical protein